MGFKERLKEKRLEAGLTQAELAEKVSVTARTIQNYEMGSRKPGNMKVVGDIATVLGTTPEYLLTSADVYSVEAHQKGVGIIAVITQSEGWSKSSARHR